MYNIKLTRFSRGILQTALYLGEYLADPGKVKGCFTNTVMVDLLCDLFSSPQVYSATKPKLLEMGL